MEKWKGIYFIIIQIIKFLFTKFVLFCLRFKIFTIFAAINCTFFNRKLYVACVRLVLIKEKIHNTERRKIGFTNKYLYMNKC